MAEEQNRTLNDKFMLRLPDGMRDRIKHAAEANNRSMNAEIVARLEESFNNQLGRYISIPIANLETRDGSTDAKDQIIEELLAVSNYLRGLVDAGLLVSNPDASPSDDDT